MEAKQILEKVKQYFAELTNPIPEAIVAKEYELKDGGKITIDTMEEGGIVMIDGAPALPGDVELMDGTILTIGDNGVITMIKMVEKTEEPMLDPAIEMQNKFSAFQNETAEKFAAYEAKFEQYESKLKKATKVIDQLLQLSQLIVDAPQSAPDSSVKVSNNFKEDKKKDFSILFN
jgi:hypothetical protein